MNKKIKVIGSGPAGIFAAYTLANSGKNFEIEIIDKGGNIEERSCSNDPSNALHGIGGAGLKSDGKLILDRRVGNNLAEVTNSENVQRLIDDVEKIFMKFGAPPPKDKRGEAIGLERKALQHGIEFVYPRQTHIGTNQLRPLMEEFQNFLEGKGVKFSCNTEIKNLDDLEYDYLILAPGRVGGGSGWMEDILKEKNATFNYRPIDIGVRVEVPSRILGHVTDITRDMKFYIVTEKYRDMARTFCTCPNGYVSIEVHDGFNTINGHSHSGQATQNTNFALLVTIPLTKPLSNTNTFARNIGKTFCDLGAGKPLLQRWGDLRRHQRSKEEKQSQYNFQPTLKEVTWGDLGLAMPERYLTDIKEAMDKLNKIAPGLTNDSTLLYAPEIKFHGLKINTDNYLQAVPGIYVAGDGSGISRGIVGSAASGILAAEGILRYS